MALETRSFDFDIRAEEKENNELILEGRPIIYDSETSLFWCREVIDAGALEGADLKDVRFMVNHDMSKIPLARSRNNNENSTMQLIPDKEGMRIRVRLDGNNTEARNLYSSIARGDVTGMSFQFSVEKEFWEDLESDMPLRHVIQIGTVIEVSAVTFPAYEATEIEARNSEALESAKRSLDNARKTLDSEKKNKNLSLLKIKTIALKGDLK